jgi:hypothetical protein
MLWMVTVGLDRTRRTTMTTASSMSSAFHRSTAAFPSAEPDSDVQNVTAEPITVMAPVTAGHGGGQGELRRAISRMRANRTTWNSVVTFAPLNAESR